MEPEAGTGVNGDTNTLFVESNDQASFLDNGVFHNVPIPPLIAQRNARLVKHVKSIFNRPVATSIIKKAEKLTLWTRRVNSRFESAWAVADVGDTVTKEMVYTKLNASAGDGYYPLLYSPCEAVLITERESIVNEAFHIPRFKGIGDEYDFGYLFQSTGKEVLYQLAHYSGRPPAFVTRRNVEDLLNADNTNVGLDWRRLAIQVLAKSGFNVTAGIHSRFGTKSAWITILPFCDDHWHLLLFRVTGGTNSDQETVEIDGERYLLSDGTYGPAGDKMTPNHLNSLLKGLNTPKKFKPAASLDNLPAKKSKI